MDAKNAHLEPSAKSQLWPYAIAAAAIFTPLLIQTILRRETIWDNCYLPAARELREGRDLYESWTTYVYPPLMAWLCVPFLSWPLWASRAAIFLINVGFIAYILRSAWRLAGGQPLTSRSEHGIFLLGLASGFLYMCNCLSYPQSDLFIAALMFGGCLAFEKNRPMWAATLWGIAAGAKCTPLLWFAYLIWRKEWRASLWLALVAVGINLLPELTCPAPQGTWLGIWFERFIAPLAGKGSGVGQWYSLLVYNQSLQGAAARLFLFDPMWEGTNLLQTPRADSLSPTLVKRGVLAIELLLLGACFLAMRFGKRWTTQTNDAAPRTAVEMSAVMILMLLLSPMSSKYHFGLLILPGFLLARKWLVSGNRWAGAVLLASLACGAFATKTPWGMTIYSYALWYSATFWQSCIVLAGCFTLLCRRPAERANAQLESSARRIAA